MSSNVSENYSDVNFDKLDTLIAKGVAIILMYVHHLYAFPDRIINGNYYNSIFEISGKNIEYRIGSFGKICVCIFMLLSGFGTYKFFIKNKNFIFIKNKLLKFYIIYWICFVVFIPLGYIMGYSRKYNFLEILSNISCYKITYNGEWWFATPFVCIMILSPIILNYLEERKVNSLTFDILMIVTFAVIIRTILPHVIKMDIFSDFIKSSYWRILYSAIKLLPSFLIGCICAKYNLFNKFREGFKSKKIMLITSFVILIIVFYCRSKSGRSYSWDYIYAPFFIIASTNIINELGIIKKIFVSIGKKSTYMWLIHSFFCYQYFQSFIYSMHNSILILLFLVFITYLTAAVLNELNKYIIVYGKKYFFESRNN